MILSTFIFLHIKVWRSTELWQLVQMVVLKFGQSGMLFEGPVYGSGC